MNSKNIKKHLNNKLEDWLNSVDDETVKKAIRNNVIITGGSIVSLLLGEAPHDYDVYFRNKDALVTVANYYIDKWNKANGANISLVVDEEGRVKVWVQSDGVAGESDDEMDEVQEIPESKPEKKKSTEKYSPKFLSSNAITLTNKIQIVTRFYGEVGEIHENYDYVHCTCSWSAWNNNLDLPVKALECIINKELVYVGSKYPFCSIIRARKYINRGYHISAGQFVKMAMQLNELDLNDINVLTDQLTGVDSGYFAMMIEALESEQEKNPDFEFDSQYVVELIDRMF